MGKKKKQIIIIAIVLLLCIVVTTTVVLINQNSDRKQEGQTVASGEACMEEQLADSHENEDASESATQSSNSTEGKKESEQENTTEKDSQSDSQTSTEEAKKPTAESGSTDDGNKPTGGTTNNNPPQTTQSTTQAPVSSTTEQPTTQTPTTTEQPSCGNGGNTHQHTWQAQYRTVHHDEEGHYENVCVKEAYDEPIYESRYICHYCNQAFGRDEMSHFTICGPPLSEDDIRYVPGIITTAGSSYSTGRVQVDTIHHEAVYEKKWIVDKKAYDEQVLNGYKCTTCEATK